MKTKITKPESEHVADFQDKLGKAKGYLRACRAHAKAVYKIRMDAGDCKGAAAVNHVMAEARAALAALDKLDAVGSDALIECYDEPGPVILGGGR